MTDLEIVLITILTAITLAILSYVITDYKYTKESEELKRKKELQRMTEDIRKIKRDIIELRVKQGICTTDEEGNIKFIYR